MTSVSSPLAINPLGPTLLLGYEPDLGVFAGFDLRRHGRFTEGSPSVQIDIRTCRKALQDGYDFDRKNNQEIAIAFRPDQIINYAYNSEELHRLGSQPATLRLLKRATSLEEIPDSDLAPLPGNRRELVQTVRRLSRSANFRQQVMNAYGNRCAVTRMQLRLAEAAHILPVGAPGSNDDVRNGLSLSPTYHRAFDSGLIYLDDELTMRLNAERRDSLVHLRLVGGIDRFCEPLGPIHLPPDRRQHPQVTMIRRANQFRGIPTPGK